MRMKIFVISLFLLSTVPLKGMKVAVDSDETSPVKEPLIIEQWAESFLRSLRGALINEKISETVEQARKDLSSRIISYDNAFQLKSYFSDQSRTGSVEENLQSWLFLKNIKWPKQKNVDALMAYLFYPIQFDTLPIIEGHAKLRSSIQYLMALSAFFGNALAQVQCASIMHLYDLSEEELPLLSLVEQFFSKGMKKNIELLCSQLSREKSSVAKKSKAERISDERDAVPQEPSQKRIKEDENIGGKSDETKMEEQLPAHFGGLLLVALGKGDFAKEWLKKCSEDHDSRCSLRSIFRNLNQFTNEDRQLVDSLYSSSDKTIKAFGAYARAHIEDEKKGRIALFTEAGDCGIAQGYEEAALLCGKSDIDRTRRLLEMGGKAGLVTCYKKLAESYLKQAKKTDDFKERSRLHELAKSYYLRQGAAGDSEGFILAGHLLCKEGRGIKLKSIMLKHKVVKAI